MPARVIAFADAFVAMCSTRTYRAAMDRDQVLREITEGSGTQFDPDLVPLFIKLDFSEWEALIELHRDSEPEDSLEEAA